MTPPRGTDGGRIPATGRDAPGLNEPDEAPPATTQPSDLRPDCTRCAALCCVLLAFDEGADFAFDKPAHRPCPNLTGHACAIHSDLAARGFRGCVNFDCRGAGQRVVQDIFGGRSWRDDPTLKAPMAATFRDLRAVQDQRVLLHAAAGLPLSPADEARRRDLDDRLALRDATPATYADFAASDLAASVAAFVDDLRRYVTAAE